MKPIKPLTSKDVKPKASRKRTPHGVVADYEVDAWSDDDFVDDPESPFEEVEIKDADGKPIEF